jgi:hypothetical protein
MRGADVYRIDFPFVSSGVLPSRFAVRDEADNVAVCVRDERIRAAPTKDFDPLFFAIRDR